MTGKEFIFSVYAKRFKECFCFHELSERKKTVFDLCEKCSLADRNKMRAGEFLDVEFIPI